MSKAIFINEQGGPEVLSYENNIVDEPGAGQVLIRHTAIGVNYIDTYYRSGLYPAETPFIPGDQASGIIEAVGADVTGFHPGQRVAYAVIPLGAYSELRVTETNALVHLPDEIDDEVAGATLIRGLTAEYLTHRLYELKPGETVLVHAAAGGTGRILCQWANKLGVRVLGTVGAENKIDIAKANGCHEVYLHGGDFVPAVKEATKGQGVDVVYDSIGKTTFMGSLDCLRPRGMMVSFGISSGKPAPPLEVLELAKRGSLFLTRPTLYSYIMNRDELLLSSQRYFKAIMEGSLSVESGVAFPLRDAADAHRYLENRTMTGSPILIPMEEPDWTEAPHF